MSERTKYLLTGLIAPVMLMQIAIPDVIVGNGLWFLIGGLFLIVVGALVAGSVKQKQAKWVFVGFLMVGGIVAALGAADVLTTEATIIGGGDDLEGIFEYDISANVTAGDWQDGVVADEDLWNAAGEYDCNGVTMLCTMSLTVTRNSDPASNAIAADEALIALEPRLVRTIGYDPDVHGDTEQAKMRVTFLGAIPLLVNSSSGDDNYLIERDGDGRFYCYIEDKAGNAHFFQPGESVDIGQWTPGESDADPHIGCKVNPIPVGYTSFGVGETWQLKWDLDGDAIVTLSVTLVVVS